MPNITLEEALKEAFASAPANVVYLETLEIRHASLLDTVYIVKDRAPHTFTLEDGVTTKFFEAASFRMALPASGEGGFQELNITLDNIDQRVSDFLSAAAAYPSPCTVIYRPYLANDPTTVQMNPPLTLWLTDIVVGEIEVNGRAVFADIINKKYPSELYTRARFPSLNN